MKEKEYREIKEMLRQLEQKIDTLYRASTEQEFELEVLVEPAEVVKPAVAAKPVVAAEPVIVAEPVVAAEPVAATEPAVVGDLFASMAHRPTVADSLAKNKNKGRLKDAIPLNDKFLYVKVLFSENTELYESTLDHLQSLENLQQAETYLAEVFPNWELFSPAVQKFLTLLKDVF
ncbi:MAG: hypothetical protein GX877_03425 [Bacteroidales bacterium]|nr:hypothetical protein [Bacteroidales bacterium]